MEMHLHTRNISAAAMYIVHEGAAQHPVENSGCWHRWHKATKGQTQCYI